MTRSELIEKLAADYPGLTKDDLKRVVETMFDEIVSALENGGRVEFRGFGNFESRQHKAKMARNPRTGEKTPMDARHYVHFKASKLFLKKLNQQSVE